MRLMVMDALFFFWKCTKRRKKSPSTTTTITIVKPLLFKILSKKSPKQKLLCRLGCCSKTCHMFLSWAPLCLLPFFLVSQKDSGCWWICRKYFSSCPLVDCPFVLSVSPPAHVSDSDRIVSFVCLYLAVLDSTIFLQSTIRHFLPVRTHSPCVWHITSSLSPKHFFFFFKKKFFLQRKRNHPIIISSAFHQQQRTTSLKIKQRKKRSTLSTRDIRWIDPAYPMPITSQGCC